ncbi:thiamine-phosphate kinase [Granulicella sp. 5B5]|uniref:thiamine-phosphate kinase n=1 Tax=Granulicella sp. 5B5 TaxID=1617967 RepID=UPI0015F5B5EC|nr:thiamine-phosphate kinase [Granulicella sp. 5B5]QMV18167.1 thiamine-phosphate kinase [Granulicella sp. 5B5]
MPRKSHNAPASGELALIARIREAAKARHKHLRLGIGDDCAILAPPPGHEILVTTDFSLEGRHFRREWHPARSIGHRALARGLSDLAAMGATPLAAFLSLALPRSANKPIWINNFLDGLLTLAAAAKTPLAGGDTSESPSDNILADIVLLGSAPASRSLRRSTARPGDLLYVTGALGGAATELATLALNPRRYRNASPTGDHPHLYPQPRLTIGQTLLRRQLATACIDISDGLSTDLAHLCTESGVAAEIQAARLPLHRLTKPLPPSEAFHNALHGGEDYELLFTARPQTRIPRFIEGVPITPIGVIHHSRKAVPQVTLVQAAGDRIPLQPQGWQHLL